jgi:hypothetical protein
MRLFWLDHAKVPVVFETMLHHRVRVIRELADACSYGVCALMINSDC